MNIIFVSISILVMFFPIFMYIYIIMLRQTTPVNIYHQVISWRVLWFGDQLLEAAKKCLY